MAVVAAGDTMAAVGAMEGVGDMVVAIVEWVGDMAGEVRAGGMVIVGVDRVGVMAGVDPPLTATMAGKKQS